MKRLRFFWKVLMGITLLAMFVVGVANYKEPSAIKVICLFAQLFLFVLQILMINLLNQYIRDE